MCGITIAISKSDIAIDPKSMKAINDKVSHRGPDDEGFYFGESFAFGHRRLSILDLSKAGHQPMRKDTLCITYNGEIYNYIELKEELSSLGHSFISTTDTEVILAAYRQWGTNAFEKFNGMWAFAIYDEEKNEIVFCRDHFGIKPLYYSQINSLFIGCSEIKQLTEVEGFLPILNKSVTVNFLVQGLQNYSDDTFFEGVKELLAGHYLIYKLETHKFEINKWYELEKLSKRINDRYEFATNKVHSLLNESIRIRMRSDVTVGSCLSGGIDSSSIVSIISSQRLANANFLTVTSCYVDKKYDEQEYSDVVANATGFKNAKTFPQLNDLWDEKHLDKMIYHQDQPFSGASCYSEFKVFEEAKRNGIIVMQDGQGADEYLCGYDEFFMTRINELVYSFRWFEAFKHLKLRAAFMGTSTLAEFRSFMNYRFGYKVLKIIKTIFGKNENLWLNDDWRRFAKEHLFTKTDSNIRELSFTELLLTSIPFQLHSEDRNSMMFSVESRLPFLDPRLVEYCIGLPSDFKIKNGYTKSVLRDAVFELPDKVRYRKRKMGFVAPDSQWILNNKTRVREDLADVTRTTGIFTGELLNRFDRFVSGEIPYESIYFRAMTLKRFCDIFKVGV
jgi:asparagine synthase (glutamine-hydrolysing)